MTDIDLAGPTRAAIMHDTIHFVLRIRFIVQTLLQYLFLLALPVHLAGMAAAESPIDFNRDVRPILTKNCTTCHGGVMRAGGVSFLYREDVLGEGDSGLPVAVPGHPEKSEMIARIMTNEDAVRMPPPDHHPDPLADEEIEILTRWISEGAEWMEHWAFQPPEKPDLPEISDPSWPAAPLDHFILARLDGEDLAPSSEAGPAEWLRRATFDLTGLPPTLEEYDAFTAAHARDPRRAREEVADRLLASPAFGKRWATMWLDLARYSDTFGFEKDPHRDIWPYRDWVVDAFNADMPYDDFTVRQIAGDLLDDPDPRDLIATAFHRNTQNNTEGGTDDEEYRMEAVIDRTNTTWTAWNAMTIGCVQCHDHPYDPIPHKAYFEFLAFFNNTEDVDIDSDFPRTKVAADPELQAEAVKLEQALVSYRNEINDQARETAVSLDGWSLFRPTEAFITPDTGRLDQRDDGDILSSGTTPDSSVFTLRGPAADIAAIKLEILPLNDDPAHWDERGAVVTNFQAHFVSPEGERREIRVREVVADYITGPFDPQDTLRGNARGFGEFPMMKAPRTAWFVPEEPAVPQPGETLELTLGHGARCNGNHQNTVLRRFRVETTADPRLAEALADPERAGAWQHHASLQSRYNSIDGLTIPVMRERPEAATRETRVFIRGNRTTLDEVVEPNIPEIFGRPEQAESRLDMARWLTSEKNPTSARVLANRLWAEMFGIGIVETLGDFGSSGALPSHPELLDFLAIRLREHHQWHIKPFLREIVLSSTYRQSNRIPANLLEIDPHNRLLARGPRQRLTAEMVRDQGLALSGLMHPELGGPPVFPPQPDGVWNSVYSGATWNISEGPDRFRRAIYTYHKRTAGHPGLLTFDAPDRDLCTEQRQTTNTPLQALVTLNDPAHIEFAAAFATRMADAGDDPETRLVHGYRMLTLRPPEPEILGILVDLHSDALADYRAAPDEAAALADDGTPERAALILVANTLLNSDHALNR